MNNEKVSVFLPCRKGSQRVPKKNVRPIGSYALGLLEIKLNQLLSATAVDEVVLSTDDEDIINYASSLNDASLRVHKRDPKLSSSETSTDQLISHAAELISEGIIVWTHVTSPFFRAHDYDAAVGAYFRGLKIGYDSLMSVTPLQTFVWNHNGPLNYDRSIEKWPRTQTLAPVYEINSAVFISSAKNYSDLKDRIGRKPIFFELSKVQSVDIDDESDFELAYFMLDSGFAVV